MRVPTLKLKVMIESDPLTSRILVRRLAAPAPPPRPRHPTRNLGHELGQALIGSIKWPTSSPRNLGHEIGPLSRTTASPQGTLMSLGYRVSHFHREPEAIKTDAPNALARPAIK